MKQFFGLLALNVVAIILAALAFYMVYAGKQGYGWVILAALIATAYPKQLKA